MKLDKHKEQKINTELSIKKKQKQEFKKIGELRPMKGHKLYEINTVSGEITLAEYKSPEKTVHLFDVINESGSLRKEVIQKKDCIYISALNIKSAKKRYESRKGSASMNERKPLL
jgi:hypothetical protein